MSVTGVARYASKSTIKMLWHTHTHTHINSLSSLTESKIDEREETSHASSRRVADRARPQLVILVQVVVLTWRHSWCVRLIVHFSFFSLLRRERNTRKSICYFRSSVFSFVYYTQTPISKQWKLDRTNTVFIVVGSVGGGGNETSGDFKWRTYNWFDSCHLTSLCIII